MERKKELNHEVTKSTKEERNILLSKIRSIIKSDELKGRFARGGIILTGASGFEVVLRFIRNIILVRLLAPEYFGLMATIMSSVAVSEAFTEVGIRQAVIQNKHGKTSDFLNVAFWFSAIRAVCLYLIAFFISPLLCSYFKQPELLVPMRVAFSVLFFNGIICPKTHVLERDFNFLKWIIIKQTPAVINLITAVLLSLYYKSVWPLVLGYTIEHTSVCLFSYLLLPFRPSMKIDRKKLTDLLHFARGMVGLPILSAVFFQFDIFMLGRFVTMEELGLYSMARIFALVPLNVFSKIVSRLVLSAFTNLQNKEQELRNWFLKITDLTIMISMPVIGLCIVASRSLLAVVYGEKYAAVSTPFSILMTYVMVRMLSTIMMQLYFSYAKPHLQRRYALVRAIIVLVIAYPAIKMFGLVGGASTVLIGMLSLFVLQLRGTVKLTGLKMDSYLKCLLRGLMYSSIVLIPGFFSRIFLFESDIVIIIFCVVLCFAAWAVAINTQHYKNMLFRESHEQNKP